MKIKVTLDCSGHGHCTLVNERLFPLDDDGFCAADGTTVPAEWENDARRGALECPSQAILLVED